MRLIWLMKRLVPGYRTIAKFRQENWKALKATNREFVLMLRELNLVGGEVVAIDGAFFDGNASKASIKTQRKIAKRLTEIEHEIEAYGAALEANDRAEAERPPAGQDGGRDGGEDVAQKVAALMAKRATVQADLAQLEESGQTQLSRTDADARLLSKNGQVVAGYNVQIAVDDKHKLIPASDVVNDGNDTPASRHGQGRKGRVWRRDAESSCRHRLLQRQHAQGLRGERDRGLRSASQATARLEAQDRISHEAFAYDAEANVYRCPAGRLLSPTDGRKTNGNRIEIRYVSRKSDCDACAMRSRCLSPPRRRRAPSTAASMKRCWNGIAHG